MKIKILILATDAVSGCSRAGSGQWRRRVAALGLERRCVRFRCRRNSPAGYAGPTGCGRHHHGGGDVTLGQGFWHGGSNGYDIYLPLLLR